MLKNIFFDAVTASKSKNLKSEIITDIMKAGSWLLLFAIVVLLSFRARLPFFITGSLWLAIILVVISAPFIIKSKLKKHLSDVASGTVDAHLSKQRAAGMFFYSVSLSVIISLLLSLLSILQQSTGVLDVPIIIVTVWLFCMIAINIFWFFRWAGINGLSK